MFHKIGFIGLGLIGGSIAKKIHTLYPEVTIIATAGHQDTIAKAYEQHLISNQTLCEIDDFYDCDYIFLCTPVRRNIDYLRQLKGKIKPGCIITDVGSVKTDIHKEVIALDMEECFIGGHPMAGSEKTGIENAKALLLENAYYVLTPAAKVTGEMVERYRDLVASLKAIPLILTYEKHDYVTAAISHLPHIIASSLVNLVKDCDYEDGTMKKVAAGGFKDITRIASSSPEMWEQICLENHANISEVMDTFIKLLEDSRTAMNSGNGTAIHQMFNDSRSYRNSFSSRSMGSIKKTYRIFCDIIDESGAIATIATTLAVNGISIKNIGIVHSREFEEGVLQIEFYEEEPSLLAAQILRQHRYQVWIR